jgi:hypothetical protein
LVSCKKSFLEDGVNYNVTRGLRTGYPQKSESIRITLSDLDPQLVVRRETGHFQDCFPVSRSVTVLFSHLSPRYRMHTAYTHPPSPRPRSSRSRALRSIDFFHV